MLLSKNIVSDRVTELYKILAGKGYLPPAIKPVTVFGPEVEKAVIAFQTANQIDADGIVGPITAGLLGLSLQDQLAYPIPVPNGYREIMDTFGNPLLSGWRQLYLDFVATPPELDHIFPMNHRAGKRGFVCNKLLVIAFSNVYKRIVDLGLADKLESFDGCFNIRNIKGRDKLSTHSWGISVDHNAKTNPLGAKPTMDQGIVAVFQSEGFKWGGTWSRPDGMHLQYAMGY